MQLAPVLIPVEGEIKSSTVKTSSGAVPATFAVTRENGFSNPGWNAENMGEKKKKKKPPRGMLRLNWRTAVSV